MKAKKTARKARPVPEGFSAVTAYLVVRGAAKALEFYAKAFDAAVGLRIDGPDGKLGHAEITIGGAPVMLADEHPEMGFKSPQAYGGTPVSLVVYVEDVDTVFARALSAGAKELRPVQDQFYGDRSGTLVDPFGHVWTLATHVEDLSPEELQARAAAHAPPAEG